MNEPPPLLRVVAAVLLSAAAAGCGPDRDLLPAGTDAVAQAARQPASLQAQRATGLSHLPRPLNLDALNRSLARHYPAQFVGLRPQTAVLVDVSLDATGLVRGVEVVDRPGQPANVRKVMIERPAGSNSDIQREHRTTYDQAFGPAAAAALREVRFHPALREGRPVPYTLRMTVEFTSPAGS